MSVITTNAKIKEYAGAALHLSKRAELVRACPAKAVAHSAEYGKREEWQDAEFGRLFWRGKNMT
jgi:hypothetical protein